MAALSAQKNVPVRNAVVSSAKAAVADTFYAGALAFHTSGLLGTLTPVPTEVAYFAGVVMETVTTAIGDEVSIMIGGEIGVANTNFLANSVGLQAYVDESGGSDNPADVIVSGIGTLATGDFTIGRITAYNVDGKTWIDLHGAPLSRGA